jgi:outer membrane protein TolC
MARFISSALVSAFLCIASFGANAQGAPSASDKVWHSDVEKGIEGQLATWPEAKYPVDSAKEYTLAELVDLAEEHNPETRVAWQQAKARAAALGIARSEWYPVVAAVAVANTTQTYIMFATQFYRQVFGSYTTVVRLEYLVLDFGGRSGAIEAAKANLLAANLAFNNTHRKIIFDVMSAYYRLLNAMGQRAAAEVSLKNAQADEDDAEDRLRHGLATKPDVLEARAATAQAEYDLQAAIGSEAIAHGDLATAMGLSPATEFRVQDISKLELPRDMAGAVDEAIDEAFKQRPDLQAQLERLRAAEGRLKEVRSAWFPTLSLNGEAGYTRALGMQDNLAGIYGAGRLWNANLSLKWTIFDGTRREHDIAQARAEKAAAQAEIDSMRDRIADEVWTAYTNMKTAQRQQQAAAALLDSANESYAAARESYSYGVRNLLDVVSAQKALAQAASEDVTARSQLLLQSANLAFETGELISAPPGKTIP